MRTTSILAATLLAAVSVATEETGRRRIYFPRHVKRQFFNNTITTDAPIPSSSESSSSESSESTKRQTDFSDFINSLVNQPAGSTPDVTTVIVQSTIVVPPAPTGNRNGTFTASSLSSDSSISEAPSSTPDPASETAKKTPDTSDDVVSLAPSRRPTTPSGIIVAPTGIVSDTTSSETVTSTAAETSDRGKKPLDPLTSLLSDVASVITSVAPPLQNATVTPPEPEPPTSTLVTIPTILPSGTGVTTEPPPPSSQPTEPTTPPVSTPTITVDPPPPSNTTEPPPPPSSTVPPPSSYLSSVTRPPLSSFTSVPPPPISSNTTITNTTAPPPDPTPSAQPSGPGVTSIPHLGTTTNSQSWLPTTILLDPTSTTSGGLAPTTATGIPTDFPKAITPQTGLEPLPEDTSLIQIGLLEGYNYPFVVSNTKAAAQIFSLLPDALGYSLGDLEKIKMRKLVPLDTGASMGFITTLAVVSFPNNLIPTLRMFVKAPNSPLYNNPDVLVHNFTKQINPAIGIDYRPNSEDIVAIGGPNAPTTSAPTGNSGDPFSNPGPGEKSSTQQGTTAAIVGGSVFVAAAYGAVMFIIARRYKKKKQQHRRASSISNTSSDMQQTPRGSPALMGGALLSRDFTSNYTSNYGGTAGGRNSHGSGRSGMNSSARTQYISAPVAAENSLGWN